jgi:hypothetical protein
MAADTFPYRFVATGGMYEGTTFVYLDTRTVVTYRTDSPTCYFRTVSAESWEMRPPGRYEMTPEALVRFEAIPLRGPAG